MLVTGGVVSTVHEYESTLVFGGVVAFVARTAKESILRGQ